MKTYDTYKDSEIEWIGDIPKDWVIQPLFSVSDENKTKNSEKNENILSLSYGRIIRRDLSRNHGLIPENFDGYQVIDDGYIIIRSTDLQNDKKSLRVGLVKEFGVITNAYIGLIPFEDIDSNFLFYYLNMCDINKVFYNLGGGLRQSLNYQEFRRFPVLIPPFEDQQRIAKYLDNKTKQIDLLIEKIQKKIELLQEHRTVLINQAVTKGLDPDLEMKDSGIEWIGDVPAHWKIQRMKNFMTPREGKSTTGDEELLTVTINRGVIKRSEYLQDDEGRSRAESLIGYKKVSPFNLVNNIMKMSFRCLGVSKNEGIVSPAYSVFNLNRAKVFPEFVHYLLRTDQYLSIYRKFSKGIQESRMRLYDDYFLAIKTVLPPFEEQQRIAKYLDNKTEQIDLLIEKLQKKIELLQEHRTALINQAVTGKIRVTEEMV